MIPQVAPNWLSYALLRFESNIRAFAILGFVGSGGVGYDRKLAMPWGGGRYDRTRETCESQRQSRGQRFRPTRRIPLVEVSKLGAVAVTILLVIL